MHALSAQALSAAVAALSSSMRGDLAAARRPAHPCVSLAEQSGGLTLRRCPARLPLHCFSFFFPFSLRVCAAVPPESVVARAALCPIEPPPPPPNETRAQRRDQPSRQETLRCWHRMRSTSVVPLWCAPTMNTNDFSRNSSGSGSVSRVAAAVAATQRPRRKPRNSLRLRLRPAMIGNFKGDEAN